MEATIEVAGLRKRFGRVQALDGMTFTVRPGRVTGFVGPNGAGNPVSELGQSLLGGRCRGSAANQGRQRTRLYTAVCVESVGQAANDLPR
jgi:ABC-2 type transport system ATP-binding protein